MRYLWWTILLVTALGLAGCGYRTVGWNSSPYADAGQTVNIPLFANKTFKPNLEGVLANALIDEFARKRGLTVESSRADLSLSGEIISYNSTAISYSGTDTVREYSAAMKIAAVLRKNSNYEVLWKGELSWDQAYPANADIALQQNAEDAAIREICRRLAQQVSVALARDF